MINHGGEDLPLVELLEMRDLYSAIQTEGVLPLQLLMLSMGLVALWKGGRRRWVLPLLLGLCALLLAEGPKLRLWDNTTLPGPFSLLGELPGLKRLWWPDRALVLLIPATSLLVAGGVALIARRAQRASLLIAAVLAGGILVEAHLTVPNLPMPTTQATISQRAELLARGDGPVLILPIGSGNAQPDASMLTDQVHHGRPLVNGPMPPSGSTAPTPYREFSQSIGMAHFTLCETDHRAQPPSDPSIVYAHLKAHGIREVYLDMDIADRLYGGGPAYRDCIFRLLPGFRHERGAYLVFNVPQSD